MNQDYTVFLSYKGTDDTLCEGIRGRLTAIPGIAVHIDWKILREDERELHERLRTKLYQSDLVIALLSADARRSPEVLEELVAAWEMRIPIIPIIPEDKLGDVPWFLRDANRVSMNIDEVLHRGATSELIEKVVETVRSVRGKREHYLIERDIRLAGRGIVIAAADCASDRSPSASVRLSGIRDVTTAARAEAALQANRDQPYSQNLSVENNFLIRALPSFGTAHKIYAVSLARVSTFWGSQEQAANAREYLRSQTKSCRRLFVFPDARSAHRLRYVLAAHHRQYGSEQSSSDRGGVFICNEAQYYGKLVPHFLKSEPTKIEELKARFREIDFGVLEFNNGVSSEFHELTLSGTTFRRTIIGPVAKGYVKGVIDTFEEWMGTPPGKVNQEHGVLRWKDSFATNGRDWERALKALFASRENRDRVSSGRVFHIVFFHYLVDRTQLIEQLHQQAVNIEQSRYDAGGPDDALLDELYFVLSTGDRLAMEVKDGRFRGRLRIDRWFVDQYPYALITTLKNADALLRHYQSELHSEARERILRALDPRIAKCYDRIHNAKDAEERKLYYECVEAFAASIMLRVDLQEYHDISMLIESTKSLDNGWIDAWNSMPIPRHPH